jgi:hypothetical protein
LRFKTKALKIVDSAWLTAKTKKHWAITALPPQGMAAAKIG